MPVGAIAEALWLKDNTDFRMRPASIHEFVGPGYLNERNVRPGIMDALIETFGTDVNPYSISDKRKAILTGAIGIGKSTYAAIALSYMVHWIKCLKNPKEFYDLSEDSVIGFMMMSTNQKLAEEVIFQKVKKRIKNSEWFQQYAPLAEENKRLEKQMRFEGDIWIVPGSSEETSFEGFDILGGIVDEGDSHKITERKQYALEGYNTIESRIKSRFTDFYTEDHRGLIIVIGQAKTKSGFMMTKFKEFEKDDTAVTVRMSIWESFGWYRYTEDKNDIKLRKETSPRKSFYYNIKTRDILSKEAAQLVMNKDLIEVPLTYIKDFQRDPVKALRDLGGIPPEQEDAFISRPTLITRNQEMWHERFPEYSSPVGTEYRLDRIELPDWFSPGYLDGDFRRVVHVDTAYSPEGDALGVAMAHVPEKINKYGEDRPIIVFDMLLRIKATPSVEINFGEVREFIYKLRDERGFNIDFVTIDGFQSYDFVQQLNRNRIKSDVSSMDKSKAAYEDIRDAVNDLRCLHPQYMSLYRLSDTDPVNIAFKELSELQDVGRKIDHPKDGSKDVADAMAGCVHTLVTISKYVREARTVEREDDSGVRNNTVKSLEDLLGSGASDSMRSSLDANQPVSFDEFKRSQDALLTGAVDFNMLTSGHGIPGYSSGEDRLW